MSILTLRRHTRGLGISPRRSRPVSAGPPPSDTEAPSVPQNLSATAVSSSQIDLTWDASTDNVGVAGYNIYRDNVLVDTSAMNAYADTGLAPSTEHEYEVSAFDAASNESARSAPDSATTHQAIVAAGLIAEWRFDQGAGQVLTDQTGNGHHGQLGSTTGADAADPTWTAQGLSFDGGDFVEHDTVGIAGGTARTVLAVVKTGATFGLEWIGNGGLFTRWTLRERDGGKVRLEVAGAGHTTAFAIPLNGWFFVGATQATSNFNSCIVYFNGSAEAIPASATLNTAGVSRGHASSARLWRWRRRTASSTTARYRPPRSSRTARR
jgi:hypothetical protein